MGCCLSVVTKWRVSVNNPFGKGGRETKLLLLGLDNSGKTTILYRLKLGKLLNVFPTGGFEVESIQFNRAKFNVWEVGGRSNLRKLWKHYFSGTDGIIYVMDSADSEERLSESKQELQKLLNQEDLKSIPLLILANKQDLPKALSVPKLNQFLDLQGIKNRSWNIQGTSAETGIGLTDGMTWLCEELSKVPEKNIYGENYVPLAES